MKAIHHLLHLIIRIHLLLYYSHNQQYSIVNPIIGRFVYRILHSLFISRIVLEMVGHMVHQLLFLLILQLLELIN